MPSTRQLFRDRRAPSLIKAAASPCVNKTLTRSRIITITLSNIALLCLPSASLSGSVNVDTQTANTIYNCGAKNSCAKTVVISLPPLPRTDRPWLSIDTLDPKSFGLDAVGVPSNLVFKYNLTIKNTGQSAASPVIVRTVLLENAHVTHSQLISLSRSGPKDDPDEVSAAITPGQSDIRIYKVSTNFTAPKPDAPKHPDPVVPVLQVTDPQPFDLTLVICLYYFQANLLSERGASCYSYSITGGISGSHRSQLKFDGITIQASATDITLSQPDEALQ